MRPSFRNRVLFVEQQKVNIFDPSITTIPAPENIIWRTDDLGLKWIEKTTELIGDWRSFVRSVYLRWAITINALNVARDRYAANPKMGLATHTLRGSKDGPKVVQLAVWPGTQAAENYAASIPLMGAYGIQDLYGTLEEIVFSLYEIFLKSNPESLMRGEEFRNLRKLHRERTDSAESATLYDSALSERLDTWRRKRAYDGLHKVFRAYWIAARLSAPSWHPDLNIEDLAGTIEAVAEVRHLIVHGEDNVSKRLAELSAEQPKFGFDFNEGERLDVRLDHLMIVENFLNGLLHIINLSLLERALDQPLPAPGG